VIYAVIPLRSTDAAATAEAVRLADEFIGRLDSVHALSAGVGRIVPELSDLPESRREADSALRVLQLRDDLRVSTLGDVQVDALMLRISDSLVADRVQPAGPLVMLRAYDDEHRTELVDTLRSWLDHFGDVASASNAIHVHKNTFRYRLARIAEIGQVDLGDANVRFGLMLQLRLFA
jgi:DNA-binding PucR family transcriptional regulator